MTDPVKPVTLVVDASDPLTSVGTVEALRPFPDLRTVSGSENAQLADVVMVLVDAVDEDALRRIRRARSGTRRPVALVVSRLDEETVVSVVEAGVRAILRRCDARPEALATLARRAANGESSIPADILGRLLDQLGQSDGAAPGSTGLRLHGLTQREATVLRLVADGLETAEIARRLNYSERTIKGVLHDVTTRLHLRNRAHAVAYALREGLI